MDRDRLVTPGTSRSHTLRSLNCDGHYGLALLGALALLLLPLLGGENLRLEWRYERTAIRDGQWWRWVTAHLVHLDVSHALLNAAGLVLLWCLFARACRPSQWPAAIAIVLLALSLGFWFLSPQLRWYVGASGLLHGVFAMGCIGLLRERDVVAWIAACAFAAKLIWEQLHGPLPLEVHGPVVTQAHLYGAAGGVVAALLIRPRAVPLYSGNPNSNPGH
jgi:rhomboid family GlyGly-CTERM serine protease